MATKDSWVEKYRPEKLDDIYSQNIIINSLKVAINNKNIPHLIFYGPSGSGKTSTILALAKDIFGQDYNDRIIEFNASDERGINIIRDKIKIYAKYSIKNIDKSPSWKIIILDEADTMTNDSQFALRRIMEQYSKITRFCITCNNYNKIIEPINSRCALFRFKAINNNDMLLKLNFICNKENINCSNELINNIINISKGDLRKGINLLQQICTMYNVNVIASNKFLNELSGIIPIDLLNNLMNNLFNKNINEVCILIQEIYNNGYSLVNQILPIHNFILNSHLSSKQKASIIYKLVEIDNFLLNGCDEYIQFVNLIYFIMINI